MQQTFLPRASSGSRRVEWGNLTTLQKASNLFYLFLLWCSAQGRIRCVSHLGGSLSLPPAPLTYSPPHFTLLLPLNITAVPIYDLPLSLNVAFCIEQDSLPLPREHMFSFWVWEISDTVLLFGSSTTCFLRWPLLGPLMDRVPSSEKILVRSSRWTDRLMYHLGYYWPWWVCTYRGGELYFIDTVQLLHFDQGSKLEWQTFWIYVRFKVYCWDNSISILTISTESGKWS